MVSEIYSVRMFTPKEPSVHILNAEKVLIMRLPSAHNHLLHHEDLILFHLDLALISSWKFLISPSLNLVVI